MLRLIICPSDDSKWPFMGGCAIVLLCILPKTNVPNEDLFCTVSLLSCRSRVPDGDSLQTPHGLVRTLIQIKMERSTAFYFSSNDSVLAEEPEAVRFTFLSSQTNGPQFSYDAK